MAKKIGYFFKAHGETVEDAEYFTEAHKFKRTRQKRLLAEEACEHAWGNRRGWEWLRDGAIVTLVIDGVEAGDFDITVESIPVFTAIEIKQERCDA